MLIIFGLAALALLAVLSIVLVIPTMIVVTVVRARRRRTLELGDPASKSDAEFVELISAEWPPEAQLLRHGRPSD